MTRAHCNHILPGKLNAVTNQAVVVPMLADSKLTPTIKMRLFKTYSPKRWSTRWGHSTAGTNQKNTSTKTGKDTANPTKKA